MEIVFSRRSPHGSDPLRSKELARWNCIVHQRSALGTIRAEHAFVPIGGWYWFMRMIQYPWALR